MSRVLSTAQIRTVLPALNGSTATVVQIVAVLLGTAILTASSWVTVPLYPVPITLQTLAVTLIGAVYGGRLATLTVLAWLAEAVVGLPVLANGAGGLAYMMGPTGGYLVAFVVAAGLVGWVADRGILGRSPYHALATMVFANALIRIIGGLWLATLIGVQAGWTKGVAPFLVGGLVKAALAAGLVEAFAQMAERRTGRA